MMLSRRVVYASRCLHRNRTELRNKNCERSQYQLAIQITKSSFLYFSHSRMNASNRKRRFETRAILDGQNSGQWSNSEVIPPIVTTMTYFQPDPTDIKVLEDAEFSLPYRIYQVLELGILLRSFW